MRALIFIKLFFISALIFSQAPSKFYTTFGGNGDDVAYSCKQTLDGNYIIVGSSSSSGFGQTDMYLLKVDIMGQLMWQKFIGGFGNEIGKSVIQLSDSGFVVVGYTSSFGAGGYDIYLIRTDKNGNLIWQKTFGGLDWDFGTDLLLAADGNLVLVGNTSSFGYGKKDGVVIKCDISGNLIWQKYFGGAENDELNSIINTNDNYLALVGYTESYNDILGDHYFLKLDLNGDTLWTKIYGNPGKSYLTDLIQRVSGDYILAGAETYTNLPITQSYACNISSSASLFTWQGNYYASSGDENWVSVTKSIFGSERISYLRNVPVPGLKSQGNIFSHIGNGYFPSIVNSFGADEDEFIHHHEGTNDGGFVCVGSTTSYNSKGKDVFFIKLDSTILNYVNIVDIKENQKQNPPYLVNYQSSSIVVSFIGEALPKKVELYSINGVLLKEISDCEKGIEINNSILHNSMLLMKLNYEDKYVVEKLILR